ncbi:MAG: hypothetical protein LBC63_09340 [Holophagales bacterium]|jgi:phage gpG-like protein|nr:hypothetical protein [Holophagales bacterium]
MIDGELIGSETVTARLRDLPLQVTMALRRAIAEKTLEILRGAKEKVSGPVLRNKTGTLRRKINSRFENEGLLGIVGIKLSYAAIHEFGFDGTENVREHVRRNLRQMKEDRKARTWGKKKGTHDTKAQLGRGEIHVRAHTRHMIMPERSFLRSTLDEFRPSIKAALKDAVIKAIK